MKYLKRIWFSIVIFPFLVVVAVRVLPSIWRGDVDEDDLWFNLWPR